MKVKKLLFINTTSVPGAHIGSRAVAVKPEWEVYTDPLGVHVTVPNKGIYLYPWGGIERIEYEAEAQDAERRGPGRPKSVA